MGFIYNEAAPCEAAAAAGSEERGYPPRLIAAGASGRPPGGCGTDRMTGWVVRSARAAIMSTKRSISSWASCRLIRARSTRLDEFEIGAGFRRTPACCSGCRTRPARAFASFVYLSTVALVLVGVLLDLGAVSGLAGGVVGVLLGFFGGLVGGALVGIIAGLVLDHLLAGGVIGLLAGGLGGVHVRSRSRMASVLDDGRMKRKARNRIPGKITNIHFFM